jgi:hypothetical protein
MHQMDLLNLDNLYDALVQVQEFEFKRYSFGPVDRAIDFWTSLNEYPLFIEAHMRPNIFSEITLPQDFPRSWLIGTETSCLSQYRIMCSCRSLEDQLSWLKTTLSTMYKNAERIGDSQPEPTHGSSCHSKDRPRLCPEPGLDYRDPDYVIKLRPTLLYPRQVHSVQECAKCMERYETDPRFRIAYAQL